MTRKQTALIGALCALTAGGGTAVASTNHLLGNGGTVYVFDPVCHRVSVLPPGISDHEMINVLGQQTRCLVRRPDPFARCVKKLGPAPAVTIWRKDDWKGVDKLRNYVNHVAGCSAAHL
jgi:hypothetical protein